MATFFFALQVAALRLLVPLLGEALGNRSKGLVPALHLRLQERLLPRQEPEAPGVARLTAGLRAKFDPRGIFNAEALALTP